MSDDYQRVEIITGTPRRRRWTAEQKLRIVEESHQSGDSISAVARRRGIAANLLHRWRRLNAQGGLPLVSFSGWAWPETLRVTVGDAEGNQRR